MSSHTRDELDSITAQALAILNAPWLETRSWHLLTNTLCSYWRGEAEVGLPDILYDVLGDTIGTLRSEAEDKREEAEGYDGEAADYDAMYGLQNAADALAKLRDPLGREIDRYRIEATLAASMSSPKTLGGEIIRATLGRAA